MARKAHQIEIDEESSDEDIELVILATKHTSDVNILRNAAKALVEKDRRKRKLMASMFNAQESARVKAQQFQEAQITRLIGLGNIDDDQKQSLSESLTADSTMQIAISSSAKAGYDGVAVAADSTAGIVRDFIETPPTTEDEYESKIVAVQEKVRILEEQIESAGVPMTGSSQCKADFERDIKTAETKGEIWRCWMTYLNCLGSEWFKSVTINLINFGGGGGDGG